MASFTPLDALIPSAALAPLAHAGAGAAGPRGGSGRGASLILVFGDQLTLQNPALAHARRSEDVVLVIEDDANEGGAPRQRLHRRRASDVFTEELRRRRFRVEAVAEEHGDRPVPLHEAVKRYASRGDFAAFVTAEPGAYQTRLALEALVERYRKPLSILRDPRFLCSRWDFADILEETDGPLGFYREMRRREGALMNGDAPEGGRWRHIDGDGAALFEDALEEPDFGRPTPTPEQAEAELERFVLVTLPRLGACEYLDPARAHPFPCPEIEAMLDFGVLSPRTVLTRIERAYHDGHAPLHAAENAVYRLIGLREYQRGLARIGDIPAASSGFACKTAA